MRNRTKTVHPKEVDDVLHDPWMGWGLWAGLVSSGRGRRYTVQESTVGFGDDAPLFDWVCLDWMWADLGPEEGRYRWDDLDQVMNYWTERGKRDGTHGTLDETIDVMLAWHSNYAHFYVLSAFQLPGDMKPGEYEARIAVVDAESETSRIRLAIDGADAQLRYRIGTIRVEKP